MSVAGEVFSNKYGIGHDQGHGRYFAPIFGIILISVILVGQVSALMIEQDLSTLSKNAEIVMSGKVVSVNSTWNEEHTNIQTIVKILVNDTIKSNKGDLNGKKVDIVVKGGSVGGITQWVEDQPLFLPDEQAIVFLKNDTKKQLNVYGAYQGVFPVNNGKIGKLTEQEFADTIMGYTTGASISSNISSGGETSLNETVNKGASGTVGESPAPVQASTGVITGISPSSASAGTHSSIIIAGSGFGSTQGGVAFFFKTAGTENRFLLADHIDSWNNNQIQVEVPAFDAFNYPASSSSGPVFVRTSSGTDTASYPFTVTFGYGGAMWDSPYSETIRVNEGGNSGAVTAATAAMATWTSVPSQQFAFICGGTSTSTTFGRDGESLIYWGPESDFYPNEASILAWASTWTDGDENIIEGDVEYNNHWSWRTSPGPSDFDIQTVCTHEIGHHLFLKDLYGNYPGYPQDTAKVMFGMIGQGTTKRTLTSSDIAGIQWIYPGSLPSNLPPVADAGPDQKVPLYTLVTLDGTGSSDSDNNFPLTYAWSVMSKPFGSTASLSSSTADKPTFTPDIMGDYIFALTVTDSLGLQSTTADSVKISAISPITVTVPNGGGNWQQGSTRTITWSYTGNPGSNVKIELLKGTTVDRVINASTSIGSGGSGSYDWVVPYNKALGSDYRIRITSTSTTAYKDTSDAAFTISAGPPFTVEVPNGGETWQQGSSQTIRWDYTGSPGSYVKIELLKAGVVSRTISSSTSRGSGGSGSKSWTVPSTLTLGDDYRIRITSTSNATKTDTSNADFTISAGPPLKVVYPNGGENWEQGSAQTITWSYTGSPGSHVKIELLKGTTVNRVIKDSTSSGSGGSGSYKWTVPYNKALGSDYKVRITSTSKSTYKDTSDANFTVSAGPPITVVAPNGGENWLRGSTHTIKWKYTGSPGSKVKIELLKAGVVNRTISSSTSVGSSGSGSKSWTVPSTLTLGTDYRIRVTSTSNATKTDTSNVDFTISAS